MTFKYFENISGLDQKLVKNIKETIRKKMYSDVKKELRGQLFEILRCLGNTYGIDFRNIPEYLPEYVPEYAHYELDNIPLNNEKCTYILDIEKHEKRIDGMIIRYNMFTETHPMLGIRWSKIYNKWSVINLLYKSRKRYEDLEDATNHMIERISYDLRTMKRISNEKAIGYVGYNEKTIMVYGSFEEPLFDIYHIIKLLELADQYDTFQEFKSRITHYGFKKNIYKGYIIKKYISHETLYDILMSSKSDYSKVFKSEVTGILSDPVDETDIPMFLRYMMF